MSETSDELCLKWDGFQENTSKAFINSHKNVDFADVTLACEDGPTIKAHKIILSSSGPFFKNILGKTDHPHPMIYMRNVKSSDLEALLDFIYLGEAKVDKENLEGFLALGQELELPGLTIALCHKGCYFWRKKTFTKCLTLEIDFSANFRPIYFLSMNFFWMGLS